MNIFNWIILVLAVVGVILNIRKNRVCFLFWQVTNGYWAFYNYQAGEIAEAVTFAVFFFMSIYGFGAWGEDLPKGRAARDERRATSDERRIKAGAISGEQIINVIDDVKQRFQNRAGDNGQKEGDDYE